MTDEHEHRHRPMRIYLSGPMTGLEHHGFPAFFEAEAELMQRGYVVGNPAGLSMAHVQAIGLVPEGTPWEGHEAEYEAAFARIPREQFLRNDAVAVAECDAVAVLPGWEQSPGATFEVRLARDLGVPVLVYPSMKMLPAAKAVEHVVAESTGAIKADGAKARVELLPARPLFAIAEVLGFGAEKYADHNWRRGFKWSRMGGAALRHLLAWLDGEDLDPETGKSHLAHLGCDTLFLLEYEITGSGIDDRYKKEDAGAATEAAR